MIKLAEPPFLSIQGEGNLTGVLTVFVRFPKCNLRCYGFFQPDPADETSYIQQIDFDPKDIKSISDIPVIERGCDSRYSWDPKFKHLWSEYKDVEELVDEIKSLLPDGDFYHPLTKNEIDICFTGGEPLLHQETIIEILNEIKSTGTNLRRVQFETNGTIFLKPELEEMFKYYDFHFNISPKLLHVSGEKNAWKPDVIQQLDEYPGCLKFVINNSSSAWEELNYRVEELRNNYDVNFPVYIMPVGATKEQQEDLLIISSIANKAIQYGYHISGRLHCNIFGNGIGT